MGAGGRDAVVDWAGQISDRSTADPPALIDYTESRLTAIALALSGYRQGHCRFQRPNENYRERAVVLGRRFPNILVTAPAALPCGDGHHPAAQSGEVIDACVVAMIERPALSIARTSTQSSEGGFPDRRHHPSDARASFFLFIPVARSIVMRGKGTIDTWKKIAEAILVTAILQVNKAT